MVILLNENLTFEGHGLVPWCCPICDSTKKKPAGGEKGTWQNSGKQTKFEHHALTSYVSICSIYTQIKKRVNKKLDHDTQQQTVWVTVFIPRSRRSSPPHPVARSASPNGPPGHATASKGTAGGKKRTHMIFCWGSLCDVFALPCQWGFGICLGGFCGFSCVFF